VNPIGLLKIFYVTYISYLRHTLFCKSRFGMKAMIVESVIDITVFTFFCPIYCCQVDCDEFIFQSRKFELLNEYKSMFVINIDILVTLGQEDWERRSAESSS
jgi:hypothetical protein